MHHLPKLITWPFRTGAPERAHTTKMVALNLALPSQKTTGDRSCFFICQMMNNSPNQHSWIKEDNKCNIANSSYNLASHQMIVTLFSFYAGRIGENQDTSFTEAVEHHTLHHCTYRKSPCRIAKSITGSVSLSKLTLKEFSPIGNVTSSDLLFS